MGKEAAQLRETDLKQSKALNNPLQDSIMRGPMNFGMYSREGSDWCSQCMRLQIQEEPPVQEC